MQVDPCVRYEGNVGSCRYEDKRHLALEIEAEQGERRLAVPFQEHPLHFQRWIHGVLRTFKIILIPSSSGDSNGAISRSNSSNCLINSIENSPGIETSLTGEPIECSRLTHSFPDVRNSLNQHIRRVDNKFIRIISLSGTLKLFVFILLVTHRVHSPQRSLEGFIYVLLLNCDCGASISRTKIVFSCLRRRRLASGQRRGEYSSHKARLGEKSYSFHAL